MNIKQLTFAVGMLGVCAGALADDITQEFTKCAITKDDRQRLACYDGIRDRAVAEYKASSNKGKSGPQQIPLADLKTDMRDLIGKKVTTAGKLQVVGGLEMVFLKTDEMDMAPVTMKADALPRDDRKKLMNGCQVVLCKAVVTGTIRKSYTGQELVAESLSWQ